MSVSDRAMRFAAALLFVVLLPGLALAEDPMTIAEFEAYATGKVLTHSEPGADPYGAEEYLPDRRVRWAFASGDCLTGIYYEANGFICFDYEDDPVPKCWQYWKAPGGLTARFMDRPADAPRLTLHEAQGPLACEGPDVGT
jgi:hypothetical protein